MGQLQGRGNLIIKEAAETVVHIMREAMAFCQPGVTTKELDDYIGELIDESPSISAPKKFYKFPSNACISVNDELAHGIGSDRVIEEEDLVKIDISILHDNGMCADICRTVYHGSDPERQHLIDISELCVLNAIKDLKAGKSVQSIGRAIEETALDNGVFVVEELMGHGIGKTLHEPPTIPTTFSLSKLLGSERLEEGDVICIEPVITRTSTVVYADGRVYMSGTGAHGAQYEDMILVGKDSVINLTGAV